MATSGDESATEPVAQMIHDFGIEQSVSTTVATALARAADTDPMALRPLFDHIDTDALDALVAHGSDTGGGDSVQVDFSVDGFDVCVRGDGEVLVYDRVTPTGI